MKEKILIIEDDFTIQTQLKTLLSGNGYEVFAVTDFSQTINQIARINKTVWIGLSLAIRNKARASIPSRLIKIMGS